MVDAIGGTFFIIVIILVWGDTVLKHATHFMYDLQELTRPIALIKTVETKDDVVQVRKEPKKPEEVVFQLSDKDTWGSFDEDEYMKVLEQKFKPKEGQQ